MSALAPIVGGIIKSSTGVHQAPLPAPCLRPCPPPPVPRVEKSHLHAKRANFIKAEVGARGGGVRNRYTNFQSRNTAEKDGTYCVRRAKLRSHPNIILTIIIPKPNETHWSIHYDIYYYFCRVLRYYFISFLYIFSARERNQIKRQGTPLPPGARASHQGSNGKPYHTSERTSTHLRQIVPGTR